jgi:hypothetical protein
MSKTKDSAINDQNARVTSVVTFAATIPIKAAAIDIHGDTGARLTLEIADSDLADFLPIVMFRNTRLIVTIEKSVD